jgi:translation initiation factor 2B subunit (eIF-2B alpha/beta/delta family)
VDAALPMLLSQAALLWLGADAVTDRGVIVNVGGFAAALAAREHSVPVYVLATRRKFLPAKTAALSIDERPPAEVWEAPPVGVRPRTVRAELVPLGLRGVVVEDGVLGPTEIAAVALDRTLPQELGGSPGR